MAKLLGAVSILFDSDAGASLMAIDPVLLPGFWSTATSSRKQAQHIRRIVAILLSPFALTDINVPGIYKTIKKAESQGYNEYSSIFGSRLFCELQFAVLQLSPVTLQRRRCNTSEPSTELSSVNCSHSDFLSASVAHSPSNNKH